MLKHLICGETDSPAHSRISNKHEFDFSKKASKNRGSMPFYYMFFNDIPALSSRKVLSAASRSRFLE